MTDAASLVGMAFAAYLTRIAGLLAARRVSLDGRAIFLLDAASIAIIASLLAVELARLSWHIWIATAAAMVVMRFRGSILQGMAVAVLLASSLRILFQ